MILSLHFLPNLFFFSSSHEYLDFSGFAQILWIFDGWQGWFYCWKHKKTKYYCFTFLGCLSSKRSKCQLFFVCFHYFIFELGLSFFSTNLLSLCQIFNKKKLGTGLFRFPLFYTVPHLGSFKDEWTMMMWIMFDVGPYYVAMKLPHSIQEGSQSEYLSILCAPGSCFSTEDYDDNDYDDWLRNICKEQ